MADENKSGQCRSTCCILQRFFDVRGTLRLAVMAVLAMTLAGCAATASKVRVQQAEAELAACRSFDWLAARDGAASLNEQRVRTAALQQLQEKGYEISADQPDCRITYVLSFRERESSKPRIGVGAGGGSHGIGGGIGVSVPITRKDRRAATFTLDVIDVASNAQVWSGSLDTYFANPELTREEVAAVVARILARFP